jgi:hypothetical protein
MLNLWRDFDRDQCLKQEDYTSFRTTGQLPAGTRIWLGSINDADPNQEPAVIHAVPAVREHVSAPRSWRISRRGSAGARTASPVRSSLTQTTRRWSKEKMWMVQSAGAFCSNLAGIPGRSELAAAAAV